ncbi:MAG: cytochrome c-type biosis protein CcmH [Frankiaceae bacterium]|nr:cytochrome c-type biosis protein CcmH [Frankiaceae bacterium]
MNGRRALAPLAAFLLAAVVVVSLLVASRSGTPTIEQRAHRLDTQLRCPVCQGLSVADSPSSTSQAIATDVLHRVQAGQSDQAVRDYYVGRYGSWILLSPSGPGAPLVWLLPVAGFAAALALLTAAFRRWTRRPVEAVDVEDEALGARLRVNRRLQDRGPR